MAPNSLRRACFHGLRLWNYVAPLYWDRARFPDDVFLVVGSGRSGTTWIADVIAKATNARIVFEPFLASRKGNFVLAQSLLSRERVARNYPLYIPARAEFDKERHEAIERILRGRIRTFWSEMEARPGIFPHRVVKDIRANLFLGFIAENWPGVRIILVLRNPYSVISSQLERIAHRWDFEWDRADVLSQGDLMKDWLLPFSTTIERAHTPVERLANRWCIETYVGLRHLKGRPTAWVVSYEGLSADPSRWDNLAEFLSPGCWRRRAFRSAWGCASFTASRPLRKTPERRNDRSLLDNDAKAAIAQIISEYGLGELVTELVEGSVQRQWDR